MSEQTLLEEMQVALRWGGTARADKCFKKAMAKIDELERQLAEAQKDQADAKRYRWLSAQYIPARAILDYRTAWIVNVESHLPMGDTFDQAIDAAMKAMP